MLTECERGACCSSPSSALRSSAGSAVAYARAAPLDGQFLRALTRSLMVPDRTRQDKHHFATDKAALSVHGVTGAFVSVLAMQSYFPADQKKKMNAACRQLSCHPSCVIHGELFITMHHFREARILSSEAFRYRFVIFHVTPVIQPPHQRRTCNSKGYRGIVIATTTRPLLVIASSMSL